MALRVVQWATGGVGVAAIKGVLEHPDLELAGCWVHSEAKDGKVRVHAAPARPARASLVGQLDEHLQREPRPKRRVTQK